MSQTTKELMLEILSEESSSSLSSHSNKSSSSLDQEDGLASFSERPSSPLKEEGWEEGKDINKQIGVVVGELKDLNDQSQPLVEFPGNSFSHWIPARTTVQLKTSDFGKAVVLLFEKGDRTKPIVMGVIQPSLEIPFSAQAEEKTINSQPLNAELDGERVTLTAKKEISLQCGKASITLTKSGKIVIRGAYVSSRSSGPNLIKGGSVQLN